MIADEIVQETSADHGNPRHLRPILENWVRDLDTGG